MESKTPELVTNTAVPRVTVVVPARNEEACLERCLRSLVAQQGVSFELIVVDDASTDATAAIAERFTRVKECPVIGTNPGILRVRVMQSPPLPPGWSGKVNACWAAVKEAAGEWLLFTDADTEHLAGSLARSVHEAEEAGAALLSYSPQQVVEGFAERALMPVVFSELATKYRPKDVCNPSSATAAANGQYLLIRRTVYEQIGGHAAVAGDLLEDVALARLVKHSGARLVFRFGGDSVRTRMYRGWTQMREGWTKNLALLFVPPKRLAALRACEFVVIATAVVAALVAATTGAYLMAGASAIVGVSVWLNFVFRVRKAHFDLLSTLLAVFGGPMFAYLLLRSALCHKKGFVTWRGRTYSGYESARALNVSNENRRALKTKSAGGNPEH
ncbi:MAG TPA: glycosyltransferase family A protein [Clostridia bacterium]|nr:glycosyltransferase family A protein [Clostridia bacterium]